MIPASASLAGGLPPSVLVGLGGALGALGRYGIDSALPSARYPVSVVVVNVLGTFLAALVAVVAPGPRAVLFLAVGVCGALTTFSSFAVHTVGLWQRERRIAAVAHAAGTLLACLFAVGVAAGLGLLL